MPAVPFVEMFGHGECYEYWIIGKKSCTRRARKNRTVLIKNSASAVLNQGSISHN